jgi:hypothetical protein
VRQIGGSPDDRSFAYLSRVVSYCDARLSRKDQIKFVRAAVGVQPLGLSWLEAIESHEEMMSDEQICLGELVGSEAGLSVDGLEVVWHQSSRIASGPI